MHSMILEFRTLFVPTLGDITFCISKKKDSKDCLKFNVYKLLLNKVFHSILENKEAFVIKITCK